MPTFKELKLLQALPLDLKIRRTKQRIKEWVNYYGVDGVYVSFSGGKDSTVLLHIVRELYPEVEAVFVDTGLEYPEIRDFVKTFDNVTWLRPKMNFKQVIEKYGYPFISKEVANTVRYAKKGNGRYKSLEGTKTDKNGKHSMFNRAKWFFLLNAPFRVNDECCHIMKRNPVNSFHKKTGKTPIMGMTTEESQKRTQGWLKTGCNAFDTNTPQSNPMAFWTEQDILQYIKEKQIKIASVYGDIVSFYPQEEFINQLGFDDLGVTNYKPLLKTTGCRRTGCMFCGFGCHREKPEEGRFLLMKKTHPKHYEYIMKPCSEGGLGYKDVIDWINKNGNLNIRY